ncbi:MAG: cysteine desulfurase family protein [Verrucomicrobiae bacterium]
MVYLDHNATTPLCAEARSAMLPFLNGNFGNPSAIHAAGRLARAGVDDARERLAAVMGVRPQEIIFTGGGTESCNLGVIGLARAHAAKGRHLITSAIEHHAVLHACEFLRDFEGFEIGILPVDASGSVSPEALEEMIRPDTTVVSVMHANNETGAIQPLRELAEVCRKHGAVFHSDAVQTFGKLRVNPHEIGVSALSIAAHKFHGPQGVGALFLGDGIALSRTAHGGAHENSRRPGTENVAGIVGMAAAADAISGEPTRLLPLRETLWEGIRAVSQAAVRNGDPERTLANTLNVSFPGANGEAFLIGLDLEGLCVSSGSSCIVGAIQPSHVLLAMGIPARIAMTTVRFSLGNGTTESDVRHAIGAVRKVVDLQPLAS